ncbi:expressed unknown protein [Seminavis robusta]|uniref:Uncharacterized protein n=1 Tax=Seminavis robusta TaxID=568900 RepID=A0A9N8H6H2_9STRA|nr:expressed unknown protein [Seminavis robusta]|eukprot:Sro43_g026430.1 n/a (248) ;mRNA; r:147687-148522
MHLKGTRTYLEPRVGLNHVVEVILNVRRVDVDWFNANGEAHFQEILHLLSETMVPRQCYTEVEEYYHKKEPHRFPKDDEEKIGEKNTTSKKKQANTKKRKRATKKKQTAVVGQQQSEEEEKQVKVKDLYYAFGENLYLAYRTEEINVYKGATLVIKPNNRDDDDSKKKKDDKIGTGGYRMLSKLSKRFVVWCFKTDPNNPSASDPPDAGYLEPEAVPIANLFRAPPDEDEEVEKKPKARARKSRRKK